MLRKPWVVVGLLALASPAMSHAQFPEPFSEVAHDVNPPCPVDGDSVTLSIEGSVPNTCWQEPVLVGWTLIGNQIEVNLDAGFDCLGICLQVILDYSFEIPLGQLPSGLYDVSYIFNIESIPSFCFPFPIVVTNQFLMADAADQHCPNHGDPEPGGEINVLDVVKAVNVAFRQAPPVLDAGCPSARTDVTCDGSTNVLDVVRFVNVAFRGGNPNTEFCDPCAP